MNISFESGDADVTLDLNVTTSVLSVKFVAANVTKTISVDTLRKICDAYSAVKSLAPDVEEG